MARFDLSTAMGRFRAHWHYFWADHAFLRLAFSNAHWLGPDLVRTNQPSPRQLAYWKKKGVKTVINLRGQRDEGYYWLEKEACERLGLTLIDAPLDSRDPPGKDRVRRAKALFQTMEYPALIHCKSGADRAGIMSVLYAHYRLGLPIEEAREQLSLKYLHIKQGKTGVLDYVFDTLKLNKLLCEVFVDNDKVITLHEKFGFRRESYFREHIRKNGIYKDVIGLALLKREWSQLCDILRAKIYRS